MAHSYSLFTIKYFAIDWFIVFWLSRNSFTRQESRHWETVKSIILFRVWCGRIIFLHPKAIFQIENFERKELDSNSSTINRPYREFHRNWRKWTGNIQQLASSSHSLCVLSAVTHRYFKSLQVGFGRETVGFPNKGFFTVANTTHTMTRVLDHFYHSRAFSTTKRYCWVILRRL